MRTLADVGNAVSERRKALGLKQGFVAERAGVSQEFLSRLEKGRASEVGTRKLLTVLAVLGMELFLRPVGTAGGLDELRKERSGQ